ncbi:alpha/beta hydrolase [bacterium]|nr:alpha/beta hydrolase [candidate division CSSED10-310 bacterium]
MNSETNVDELEKTNDIVIDQRGYVMAADGTRLYYRATGSGLPLVCCNGIGCDTIFWERIHAFLHRRMQVVTWDYKGHGLSELPRDWNRLGVGDMVDDTIRIMDNLGIESAIFAGHSMGVQVNFELWHRHRDRVAGLVAVCGSYGHPLSHFLHSSLMSYLYPIPFITSCLFPEYTKWLFRTFLRQTIAKPVGYIVGINRHLMPDEVFNHYLDHLKNMDPRVFAEVMRRLHMHSAEPYLGEIDVPTLIIAGEADHFTPLWVPLKMHAVIRGSELLTIPEGKHVAHMEMPRLVNLRLEEYLQEHFPGRVLPIDPFRE